MALGAEVRREGLLRVVAVAAAAAFGLWVLGRMIVAGPMRFRFEVAGQADEVYGPARAGLAAGERVGVLIPGRSEADDQVRWFTAQHALAPAIVAPVRYAACQRSLTDPACGLAAVERVLVAGIPSSAVAALGDALGLQAVGTAGHVVVYRRRAQ